MTAATEWTWNFSYTTTDLNVSYTTSSSADARYSNTNSLSPGLIGLYSCTDADSVDVCDSALIVYDGGNMADEYYDTTTEWRALACHETGHAVGLTHQNDAYPYNETAANAACVQTPVPRTTNTVGGHNVAHINTYY